MGNDSGSLFGNVGTPSEDRKQAGSTPEPVKPAESGSKGSGRENRGEDRSKRRSSGKQFIIDNARVSGTDNHRATTTGTKEEPQGSQKAALELEAGQQVTAPKQTRQRKPRAETKPQSETISDTDAAIGALALMDFVESFTVPLLGDQAHFNPLERSTIEPALARTIKRYGSIYDKFGGLIDPVLLIAGVAMYTLRLNAIASQPPAPPKPTEGRDTGAGWSAPPAPERENVVPTAPPEIFQVIGNALS
jgi:hypothetical protein